jgi:PAS domain S-box-containing protein
MLLKDVYGNPILIFRLDMPRYVYSKIQASLTMFEMLIVGVGLVFAIVTVSLLERFVLSRLNKLSASVSRVGASRGTSVRVSVTGKDELTSLASEINNMLVRLGQSEEKLKEERDKVQTYLDIAGVMILVINADRKVALLNRKGCEILECNVEEALGKDWFNTFLPNKVKEQVSNVFGLLMKGKLEQGTALEYNENPVLTKSGKERLIAWHNMVIKDSGGRIVGTLSSGLDITERKEVEEKLRESEEKFRGIAERSFDAIAIVDLEGRISYASPSVGLVLGYPQKEVIGKPFLEYFSPVELSSATRLFTDLMQGKKLEALQLDLKRREGTTATLEINASPIIIEGEVTGIQAVFRDITERKKTEEALRESEEKLRRTLESSPDAIILTDLAGSVIDCNQATLDMYGFSKKEEVIGKAGFQFISARDYEKAMESMKTIFAKGFARNIEYTLLNKDGKEFLVDVSASIIRDASGEPKYLVAITRDITQRKRIEEALKENEEKFRAISGAAYDAIILADDEGKIVYWNPMAERIFGYSEEETVNHELTRFIIPERFREVYATSLKAFKETSAGPLFGKTVDMTSRRKDGTEFPMELSMTAFHMKGRWHALGLVRDITERKQMEAKLQHTTKRLQTLLETAREGIITADQQENITFVNKAFAEIVGYEESELLGLSTATFLDEEGRKKIAEETELRKKGATSRYELTMYRKNGEPRIVQLSASPLWNEDGGYAGSSGIVTDITERRKMEEALRESEEKTRNILQSSPDAIAVTDLNGTMIDCNQAALKLAGVSSKEELLGKNTFNLISPKEYEKSMKNMEILLEQGTVRDFEFTFIAKDGREFPAEVSISLMRDPTEEPKYFVATIKDITERKEMLRKLEEYSQQLGEMVEKRTRQLKEAQEQLVKAERLAAIGQVAAMVGHDLRNPLTGIKGATYYLKTKLQLTKDKKTAGMLELIEKNIEYSNKIITDLMDYSREIRLELTETTPKQITEEALSLVQIPEKVQIENSTQDEPTIQIDTAKMKRVFANFIKNAVEAMPEGGRLGISSRKSDDNVEFAFIDTGVGMVKEVIERLWTPFFTTKAKGMGLGLAICKRIIEAHGGKISVESIVGEGTTFTIAIPIKPKIKEEEGGEKVWVNVPESLLSTTTKA